MIIRKSACFLVFLLVFFSAQPALAKGEPTVNRYLIKSTAGLWKNSLKVRNVFEDGFTADLSDWQLRVVKLFGVDVEPVGKLYILEPVALNPAVDAPGKKSGDRFMPTASVPWGVRMMYNDSDNLPSGGEGVKVAVLDTGALKTHPDLVRRIADCKDFIATKNSPVNGRCDDLNGHGTHVAGIIAADGGKDKLGVYGVAPDASLLIYRVCNDVGVCWADDVAAAINVAVSEGANIVNISLGSDTASPLIENALKSAADRDVLVIASAGNDGPYKGSIDYPASYVNAVAVAAVSSTGVVPSWSSRGLNEETTAGVVEDGDMEFAAPGVTVESTWKDGGYAVMSGTSMSAPHVSGLAAKLWKKNLTHPAAEVRSVLQKIAVDIAQDGEDGASGFGIPSVRE